MSAAPCTGAILAGGRAARLGGARKGLLEVGGTRIVDRVAAALAGAADDLLLVANDADAAAWLPGARLTADVRPGHGSLSGVHAALACARGAALVVAWDMPFVTAPLLAGLRLLGEPHGGGVDAVVPRGPGGRREPLCAYYAPSCLPAIERHMDAGERRLSALLDALRVRYVDGAALAAYGATDVLFANVNTPDDLARAAERAAASPTDPRAPSACP